MLKNPWLMLAVGVLVGVIFAENRAKSGKDGLLIKKAA